MATANPQWKRPGFPSMSGAVRAQYHRFFAFPEGEDMGEDYSFCEAWRALGGSVFMDSEIRLGHSGATEYSGDIGALFQSADKDVAA